MPDSSVDADVPEPMPPDWLESEEVRSILEDHLDETDYQIYRVLNRDGRISDTELGERVGLSRTAARRRRKKMQEEGVLDVLAVLILQSADLAYADVRVVFDTGASREETREFIDELLREELIYEIDEYVGEYDLLVRVWHGSLQQLKGYVTGLLQNEAVVGDYEISPVIKTEKAWHKVIDNGDRSDEDDG